MNETMEMHAIAKWNEEKGCWEVELTRAEIFKNAFGEMRSSLVRKEYEVENCDEFVIIEALANANGLTPTWEWAGEESNGRRVEMIKSFNSLENCYNRVDK